MKVAKATETLPGFSTWDSISPSERLRSRLGSISTINGKNPELEGAAASKGLDGDLSLSA